MTITALRVDVDGGGRFMKYVAVAEMRMCRPPRQQHTPHPTPLSHEVKLQNTGSTSKCQPFFKKASPHTHISLGSDVFDQPLVEGYQYLLFLGLTTRIANWLLFVSDFKITKAKSQPIPGFESNNSRSVACRATSLAILV